jgi:hypothetical protein
MANKMPVSEALALIDEIGSQVATTDAALIKKLSRQLSDARFKLPDSVEVAARLLALASTQGISEQLLLGCVLAMPAVDPSFTDALAALLAPPRAWPSAAILEKLSEIGTREAGRAAGARLPEFEELRVRSFSTDAFVAGLAEGIGERPIPGAVAVVIADALKTSLEGQRLPLPVPERLCQSLAAALLPLATALRPLAHQFPTGFWADSDHAPEAHDLALGAQALTRLTPTPALGPLADALYELEDPYLLEAAVYLDLALGRPPRDSAIAKLARFPHTRFTLYENLESRNRPDLFPQAARGWLALAEGRVIDYLALEDGTIYDVVEGVIEVRVEAPDGPRVALAIRCAQSFGDRQAIGYLTDVRPDAARPMVGTTVGMFGGNETDEELRAELARLAATE